MNFENPNIRRPAEALPGRESFKNRQNTKNIRSFGCDKNKLYLLRQELQRAAWRLLAAEMRQIGAEGNYDFTATEERTGNNVKVLIRESQWYLLDFLYCSDKY